MHESNLHLKAFQDHHWYRLSLEEQKCDCPEFKSTHWRCEHLTALGIYPARPFVSKTHPSFSQALSGLVKSLRIRRVEDAVYWLVYLDTFRDSQHRFRTARRLLIASAEDGHSIRVMERVVESFAKISRLQTDLLYLLAEAARICKLPNWWHPSTAGPDYIYSGMVGQRRLAYLSAERTQENMSKLIEQGIEERSKETALAGVMGLSDAKIGGTRQAELILSVAKRYQHPLAERLAEIHLRAKSALSSDNNFLCQAAWMMAGGESPVALTLEPVTNSEVMQLLDAAKEKWKTPRPIPGWCCDGIHCAGNDARFAGLWHLMYAVCKAFEYYGRVDPEDKWLPRFNCYDGLIVEQRLEQPSNPVGLNATERL